MTQHGTERELRLLVRYLGVLAIREERREQERTRFWYRLIRNGFIVGTLLLVGAALDRLFWNLSL